MTAPLSESDLPDPEDSKAVFVFAMSFNGYEHYGSFEKCAAFAGLKNRSSRDELRNELFLAARASRHAEDDNYLNVYRALLPLIRMQIR